MSDSDSESGSKKLFVSKRLESFRDRYGHQYQANAPTKQEEKNMVWPVEDCRHIVCTAKDCPRPWPCRAGQEIYCDACYKPALAHFRCGECRKNFCYIHKQAHFRARSTYAHKIWKLVQTPSKVIAVKLPLKVCDDCICLRCTTRSASEPEEKNTYLKCGHCLTPLSSFCRLCKHCVCLECYDSECVDDSHPMGDSRTLGKEWRDSLTTNDSEKALVETLRVHSRELKSSLANISEQRETATRAAGKFYADLIAAVKIRQHQVQLDILLTTAKKHLAIKTQLEWTEEVAMTIEALAMTLEDRSVHDFGFLNTLQYLSMYTRECDVVKQANETLFEDGAFDKVMFTFSNETAATLYSDISRIGGQDTSMSSSSTLQSTHHNTDSLDTVDVDNSTPAEVENSTPAEASTAQRSTVNTLLVIDSISSDILPCHPSSRAFDTQHSSGKGLELQNGNRTALVTGNPCFYKVACSSAISKDVGNTAMTIVIDKTHDSYLYMGACFSESPVDVYPDHRTNGKLKGWGGQYPYHHFRGRRLGQEWMSGDTISMKLDRTKRTLAAMHHRTGDIEVLELNDVATDTVYHWYVALLHEGDQVSFSRVLKHQT
eukprot:scpid79848/ scgid29865/ 